MAVVQHPPAALVTPDAGVLRSCLQQTQKKGNVAKGTTAQELCSEILPHFLVVATRALAPYARKCPPSETAPLFSFDHAAIHDCATTQAWLEDKGISRVPLPPHSPDFNRVIEHAHAWAGAAFSKLLRGSTGPHSIEQYMQMMQTAFEQAVTAERVEKDVKGLRQLYTAITTREEEGGCWGGYPPHHLA